MLLMKQGVNMIKCSKIKSINVIANTFYTSSTLQLDQSWRKKKRLTENPSAFGSLTNLPDYSFLDGRPSPFGVRQLIRIQKQQEILRTVNKLVNEIDCAVENHVKREAMERERRKSIIEGKLKPKGQYLLNEPEVKMLE